MFKEYEKIYFIVPSVGHPSDIGHFLPGMEITLYVSFANVNSGTAFQIIMGCTILRQNTINLGTALNKTQSCSGVCLKAVTMAAVARKRD